MKFRLDELQAREQALQADLERLLGEYPKERGSYQLTEPKEGLVYLKRVFRREGGKPTSKSLGNIKGGQTTPSHPHAKEIIKKKRELKTVQMTIRKMEILQRREIRLAQANSALI